MSDPAKSLAAALTAKKHPPQADAPDAMASSADAPGPDEVDAAQDIIDAIRRGNAEHLAAALGDWRDCGSGDDTSAAPAEPTGTDDDAEPE